jgi:predicted dehydrogenase
MSKALVVGLGIGQLYRSVLANLNYQVVTVDLDPNKGADYTDLDRAVADHFKFDLAVICTPNFTHIKIARKIASFTGIVFIEKPGVATSDAWEQLIKDYPYTRFMMIKNNQYREEIERFKDLANSSKRIVVRWNNKNRIPNPGSWFTTKSLAFGGVSRDLIPHMLSYYCALTSFATGIRISAKAEQKHQLSQLTDTDYGVVNPAGIFDVDDFCELKYNSNNKEWVLTANWKDDSKDDSSISFESDGVAIRFELGLCPESAYQTMIKTAVDNFNNSDFWLQQYKQDTWIHQQIENL